MDPINVTAPKGRLQQVKNIFWDNAPGGTGLAHSLLFWDHYAVLGSHYCGDPLNPNDKGMPLSNGHPVWFIQDQPQAIIEALKAAGKITAADYRLAVTFLKLDETSEVTAMRLAVEDA